MEAIKLIKEPQVQLLIPGIESKMTRVTVLALPQTSPTAPPYAWLFHLKIHTYNIIYCTVHMQTDAHHHHTLNEIFYFMTKTLNINYIAHSHLYVHLILVFGCCFCYCWSIVHIIPQSRFPSYCIARPLLGTSSHTQHSHVLQVHGTS